MSIKRAFEEVLRPGNNIGLTGGMGSGKSFLAMFLVAFFLENSVHHYVFSNVICKRRIPETGEIQQAYPERYFLARSFYTFFRKASEIYVKDNRAVFLLVLDEGALAFDYMSFFTTATKSAVKFNRALIRKLETCVIMITQEEELISLKLRTFNVHIRKEAGLLFRYAGHLLRVYDRKQLALVSWPAEGIENEIVVIPEAPILAIASPERIASGAIHFDTKAAADFGMGKHRVTRKDFVLTDLLRVISGVESERIWPRIYQFTHEDPTQMIERAVFELDESGVDLHNSETEEAPPTTAQDLEESGEEGTRTDWKQDAVDQIMHSRSELGDSEVARLASRENDSISRQYVNKRRKQLRAAGVI